MLIVTMLLYKDVDDVLDDMKEFRADYMDWKTKKTKGVMGLTELILGGYDTKTAKAETDKKTRNCCFGWCMECNC